jgi:hypothetical protein
MVFFYFNGVYAIGHKTQRLGIDDYYERNLWKIHARLPEELCVVKVVSKVQDKKVSQKAVDLMEGNSLHYTVAL